MLGPIPQLVHNKYVANPVLLEISYKLDANRVKANPRFSCSDPMQVHGVDSIPNFVFQNYLLIFLKGGLLLRIN
jgi:hypothetical protein